MKSRILNQILTASVSLILITSSRTTPPCNFSCPQKSQRYQLVWQTSGGPPQILIIPYGYRDTQRITSTWATTRTTHLTTIAIGRGQQEQDNRNIYQGLLNDSVDIFQYNGLIRKEFVLFTSLHLRLTPSIVPFSPLLFWKPTISQTRVHGTAQITWFSYCTDCDSTITQLGQGVNCPHLWSLVCTKYNTLLAWCLHVLHEVCWWFSNPW